MASIFSDISMAELLDVGRHCSRSDCQQLDFLPVRCDRCGRDFCKEHFMAVDGGGGGGGGGAGGVALMDSDRGHQCEARPSDAAAAPAAAHARTSPSSASPSAAAAAAAAPCSLDGCPARELSPVTCPFCRMTFCLAHRHTTDHACTAEVKNSTKLVRTQQHIESLQTTNPCGASRPPATKLRNAKAQRTAAKVQLMKLKQKSTGADDGLAADDRVHFLVLPPMSLRRDGGVKSIPLFVSRHWPLGKVIDGVARLCKATNKNNVAGEKKLRLFRFNDGRSVAISDFDAPLESLLQAEEVFNGDTLILEYVEENVIEIDTAGWEK